MAAIAQFTSVKPNLNQWTAMETRIEEYHADQPNATEEQNAFVKKVFLNEDGNFISDARFLLLNVRDAMSEKFGFESDRQLFIFNALSARSDGALG